MLDLGSSYDTWHWYDIRLLRMCRQLQTLTVYVYRCRISSGDYCYWQKGLLCHVANKIWVLWETDLGGLQMNMLATVANFLSIIKSHSMNRCVVMCLALTVLNEFGILCYSSCCFLLFCQFCYSIYVFIKENWGVYGSILVTLQWYYFDLTNTMRGHLHLQSKPLPSYPSLHWQENEPGELMQ